MVKIATLANTANGARDKVDLDFNALVYFKKSLETNKAIFSAFLRHFLFQQIIAYFAGRGPFRSFWVATAQLAKLSEFVFLEK